MPKLIVNSQITKVSEDGYSPIATSRIQSSPFEEAVVVDVIVNDSHPLYSSDGYNVGAIKFRLLTTHQFTLEQDLPFAFPIESNIQEYPLLNEVVLIYKILNRWYYTRKINTSNKVTQQSMFGLNDEISTPKTSDDTVTSYRKSHIVQKDTGTANSLSLGNTFKENQSIRRLRHNEGDIIIEGRSGHSIRFGTNQSNLAPNMLIRIGQSQKNVPTGQYLLISEDINQDKSSIYILSDEICKISLSAPFVSVSSPPAFTGNQIVLNSDRIIFNTKTKSILLSASDGLNLATNTTFTLDSKDYTSNIKNNITVTVGNNVEYKAVGYVKSTSDNKHSFVSPKVYLSIDEEETSPVPLGDILANFIDSFISVHLNNAGTYVNTPSGPGSLSPSVVSGLTQLKIDAQKGKLASFNSKKVFGK